MIKFWYLSCNFSIVRRDAFHTCPKGVPTSYLRLGGWQLLLVVLVTMSDCASAPPPETRPKISSGRSMSYLANKDLISGGEVLKTGYCTNTTNHLDYRICETILKGRNFDPMALQICRPQKTDHHGDLNRCLKEIANVVFSEPSLEVCRQMPNAKQKRTCLGVVANRRLGQSQVDHCRNKGRPKRISRCLARSANYVFNPEILQKIVLESLRHSPPPAHKVDPSDKELRQWWLLTPSEQHNVLLTEARHKSQQQAQLSQLFSEIRHNVAKSFPQLHVEQEKHNFLFNFAGGANGQMQLLYCSDKEYLLIFGAPISVDAYSGRYRVLHIFDWILSGKMSVYHEGDFVSHDIYPGQETFLPRENTKTYSTEPMTYVLEYGRGGTTASGLEFGVRAPARALTRDFRNQRQQIQACGRLAASEEIQIIARKLRARKIERQRLQELNRDIRRVRRNHQ